MAKGIAHREWQIHSDDYQDEQAFREAVQSELALAEHIGERLGVAIVAAPIRTRVKGGGSWFTVGWVFKTATVPGLRDPEPVEVDDLEEALADDTALVEDPDDLAHAE